MRHRISDDRIRQWIDRIVFAAEPSGERELHAPWSGELIARVPQGGVKDVREAFRRAREAQPAWAARPVDLRARVLRRVHDLVFARQKEVLDLVQLESGKARRDAFEEVADVAIVSRHYAFHGPRLLRPRRRRGALPLVTRTEELHHPVGVVGIISPWNYPLTLAITDALPALLAGNAVVIKPARETTLTALWAAELLRDAGLPDGLFNVVSGPGSKIGPALIDEADFVQFTGSTETGRAVARDAAERLTPHSMELGGKNPMIVLPDAPLARAVEGAAKAAFSNTGQLCISIERLFVHESIYEGFVRALVRRVRQLKLGASFDFDMEVGSLISQAQLDKVSHHVQDALDKGATLLAGGKARPDLGPLFFEPTLLEGVTEKMEVFADESFGPVLSVYPYRSTEEVIQRANATEYGLNASIWTREVRRGRAIAERIRAGTVNINEGYAATWASADAPMGGFKASGMGRRHGSQGLLKYTEAQTVSAQYLFNIAAPRALGEKMWARLLTFGLRVLSRIPGLR